MTQLSDYAEDKSGRWGSDNCMQGGKNTQYLRWGKPFRWSARRLDEINQDIAKKQNPNKSFEEQRGGKDRQILFTLQK